MVAHDFLFGHEKNVSQGPDNPRRMRDTWCRPGLNPQPGAETREPGLDQLNLGGPERVQHHTLTSRLVSLLQFGTGPQPSRPRRF